MDYRNLSCKIIITLVSVISSTSIPVFFGRDSVPQISTSCEIGRFLFLEISNFFHCGIETQLISDRNYQSESPPSLMLSPSLEAVPLTEHSVHTGHSDTVQLLGIGPGSDIATTFGSVALVHTDTNSGLLLLNATETDFISTFCLPDSVIRMSTLLNRHTMNIPHTFGRIPILRGQQLIPIRFTPIEFILKIDSVTFERLFHQFPISVNATQSTITDCTSSRQLLPNIQIDLTDDRMLFLTPLDYTRFKADDHVDECDLLIGSLPDDEANEDAAQMNPLLIPGFNSFATSGSTLVLCEALNY